jgi:hypothetical protein
VTCRHGQMVRPVGASGLGPELELAFLAVIRAGVRSRHALPSAVRPPRASATGVAASRCRGVLEAMHDQRLEGAPGCS